MPLRPITEADLALVLGWRNSPGVRGSMFSQHEIAASEHAAWFARVRNDARTRCLIYEDQDGRPRGVANFTDVRSENRSAFWGFYAAPDAPAGTGTRLCGAALDFAFGPLGLHKVNAEVIETNSKSLHLHQKLGFQREGYFRDFHFNGADYLNVVRFGLLDSEWQQRRTALEPAAGDHPPARTDRVIDA